MKKILIALDYNPTAEKVAENGFALAKAMQAAIVLLHVVPDKNYYNTVRYSPVMGFGGYIDTDHPITEIDDQLTEQSLAFLEKTKAHLGNATMDTLVKHGNVADAIAETVAATGAAVVVMGSHSRRWLEAVLMGSVTAKVLRQTEVPLFIIPTKKEHEA
jgi:nucleotide-binding universal stress UspA family protein